MLVGQPSWLTLINMDKQDVCPTFVENEYFRSQNILSFLTIKKFAGTHRAVSEDWFYSPSTDTVVVSTH